MNSISIGKYRGLQQISSERGTFTALALDHRQNLRKANPLFTSDEQLSLLKLDVTTELAPYATAVLLDPEVSAAQAIASRRIPNQVGLVVAIESTGYIGNASARRSQILPGWSVEKAKHMGASAVKLLVYYHPDSSNAKEIENFTSSVAEHCKLHDIVLMLEPLSYSLDPSRKLTSAEKRYVVVETAKRLTPLGADILKAEFPLEITENPNEVEWAQACAEISTASPVPWILLSAGIDYEVFLRQVTIACQAGASGIAVGRAVWQEAVLKYGDERLQFLRYIAQERISRLTSLCHALAKPWTNFYTTQVTFDWYKTYGANFVQ